MQIENVFRQCVLNSNNDGGRNAVSAAVVQFCHFYLSSHLLHMSLIGKREKIATPELAHIEGKVLMADGRAT